MIWIFFHSWYLNLSSLDLKIGIVTSEQSNAVWLFINSDCISGHSGLQVNVKNTCRQPYSDINTNALLAKALKWRWNPWTLSGRYESLLGSSMFWLPYPQNHITGNAPYGTGNATHTGAVIFEGDVTGTSAAKAGSPYPQTYFTSIAPNYNVQYW